MNRTYEDMSKEELITLVTRLTKQHNEWRNKAFDLWAVIDNNAPSLLYIANEIFNPYPNEPSTYERDFKHDESDEAKELREQVEYFKGLVDHYKDELLKAKDEWQPKETIE